MDRSPGWILRLTEMWNPTSETYTAKEIIARELKHTPGTIELLIDYAVQAGLVVQDERRWRGSDFDAVVGYCFAHLS